MTRLYRAFLLTLDFVLLYVTFAPAKPGFPSNLKLYARLSFGGGPGAKVQQLDSILTKWWAPYSGLICLSASSIPLPFLRILKRRGVKVLVNQNGVYYPQWMPEGYSERNQYLDQLNQIADHSFFQSEFALKSYQRWVGEPPPSFEILPNPVDCSRFHPSENESVEKSSIPRILLFHDFDANTQPLWDFFVDFSNRNSSWAGQFAWTVLGKNSDLSLSQSVFSKSKLSASIDFKWNPKSEEIPGLLRLNSIALYLRYNDVCPNKVLECLASGLPVVALSAGGTKELVGDAGIILKVSEDYKEPQFPEHSSLCDAINKVLLELDSYKKKAVFRAQDFELSKWLGVISRAADSLWIK